LNEYLHQIDILAGGVPCQAWSQAGKRLGLQDVRGTLFNDFIRLVDECEPKVFLIENVVGLTTHNNGQTLEHLLSLLHRTTTNRVVYVTNVKILNANDFGVPQKRKRVIIIGIRSDTNRTSVYEYPEPMAYKPTMKDALRNCSASEGEKYPQKKADIMRLVPAG